MESTAIQKQIDIILQVTKEVSKTKETARQFLIDAGIVHPEPKSLPKEKQK